MNCPTCDRNIQYPKESSPTRGSDGVMYDWAKYNCPSDNTWVEVWTPQKDEE